MTTRKSIAWITVLAATHLAAFFLAHRQPEGAGAASGSQASADATHHTKSGQRDPRSPRHAQLWQKLLETPMERADFERTRDKLLKDWMKQDLGAVLDLLCGPGASVSISGFELMEALNAEIAKNPQQVLEWIRSGRFGSCRNDVFQRWYTALERDGQAVVIMAALPECTKYEQFWGLRSLSGKRDEKELAMVREALGTWYREGTRRSTLVENYARRKAELAAGNTAALFAHETDPEIRLLLGKGWMEARLGFSPTADRLGELRELPEDARAKAVADIMTTFDDDRMKGVAPALAEMNRLAMWSELASEGTRQSILVCAWNREDQPAVLQAVMAIGDAATRATLFESAGRGMASGSDGEAGFNTVLETMQQGPDRDACLVGMVNVLRGKNPDLAKRGLQGIADQAVRNGLLEQMPELRQ